MSGADAVSAVPVTPMGASFFRRLPEQVKVRFVARLAEANMARQMVDYPSWPVLSALRLDSMWTGIASGCQRAAALAICDKQFLPV